MSDIIIVQFEYKKIGMLRSLVARLFWEQEVAGSNPVGPLALKSIKAQTPLVQLVERRFPKPDVIGSSPMGRGFSL